MGTGSGGKFSVNYVVTLGVVCPFVKNGGGEQAGWSFVCLIRYGGNWTRQGLSTCSVAFRSDSGLLLTRGNKLAKCVTWLLGESRH
ncbi:hypothetical protein VNO77_24364 [Canavalia gladiata]|uniref:Uncharacterized protein n=1 Tax=Canavalia gladiata TaxID=3824 RepID=A0AAN9L650_CANGL